MGQQRELTSREHYNQVRTPFEHEIWERMHTKVWDGHHDRLGEAMNRREPRAIAELRAAATERKAA